VSLAVEIELNAADYWKFYDAVVKSLGKRRGSPLTVIGTIIVWAAIAYVFLLFLRAAKDSGESLTPTLLAVVAILLLVWGAIWLFTRQSRQRMTPKSDGFMLGKRVLKISDSGIREEMVGHVSDTSWMWVQNIVETRDHIFIFKDTVAAVIVPKRCFGSDEAATKFGAEVQELWGASKI